MCGIFGGGGGGDGGAAAARQQEKDRQDRITQGTQSINDQFTKFDDPYFKTQSDAYDAYAKPKLDQQYADARKQLVFNLSRSGILNSTEAANQERKLAQQNDAYQTDVVNQGDAFAQKSRADIEGSRNNLISQLTATEDPAAAAANAGRAADLASRPPVFDPVGTFAFNVGNGVNNYAGPATGYRGAFATPSTFSTGNAASYTK